MLCGTPYLLYIRDETKKRETHFEFLSWLVEKSIEISNNEFIESLVQIEDFYTKYCCGKSK